MPFYPFAGVKVLEWARDFPGPHAGRKLADMGADVVKLSNVTRSPEGAPRSGYSSEFWAVLDRNKRSVALDFDNESDLEVLRKLTDTADVIIEGSRPGGFTAKTGIDFAELRATRPEVVICSVSGFGQTGPLALQAAHGLNLESLSYSLYPENHDGHWVQNQGANQSVAVELGPANAAFAIAAALFAARQTGQGAWIDISCYDAAVESKRHRLTDVLNGFEPWYDTPNVGARYTLYDCNDGRPIYFTGGEPQFWRRFCKGIGREDLLDVDRSDANDDFLRRELSDIFMTASSKEWAQRFLDWNVCSSEVVMSLEELAEHPQFLGRELVTVMDDGTKQIAEPIRWMDDGTRPGQTVRFPSSLGGDGRAVLSEWLGIEDYDVVEYPEPRPDRPRFMAI